MTAGFVHAWILFACAATALAQAPAPDVVARVGAEKAEAILGQDDRVDLVLDFVGPGAEGVELGPSAVSVGQLVDIERVSPSTFVATYLPPPTSFPQVALALFSWRLPGQSFRHVVWRCPLRGLSPFPFRTKPRATVSVDMGEETFGPVKADDEGRVLLPLPVPPGVARATARAVDAYGNESQAPVALDPPPFVRSVVLAEEGATAGETFRVVAAQVDAQGALADPHGLVVLGPTGELSARIERGLAFFDVPAPTDASAGPVDLRIRLPDGTEEAGPAVPVRAAPPATLHVTADRPRLTVGQPSAANVAIFARDRFGNLTDLRGLHVTRDGVTTIPAVDGRVASLVVASPEKIGARDQVVVEATVGGLRAATVIHLQGERAERLVVTSDRDRMSATDAPLQLAIRATDRHGAPAPPRSVKLEATAKGGHFVRWKQIGESHWTGEFVADRVGYPAIAHLTIGVSPDLTARLHVPVAPVPERGGLTFRAGMLTNFGALFAPFGGASWTVPAPWLGAGWSAGVEALFVAYRFDDGGVPADVATRTIADLFQAPFLLTVGRRLPLGWGLDLQGGVSAGFELALLRVYDVDASAPKVAGRGFAPVGEATAALACALPLGEMLVGAHYLVTRIGRVSSGDVVNGNSLGFALDAGFRWRY